MAIARTEGFFWTRIAGEVDPWREKKRNFRTVTINEKEEKKMRRQMLFLGFVLAVFGLFLGVSPLQAQSYPDHPIQLVIPGAPGDALDLAGRLFIEELEKVLKVQVIPLNKPGAAGTVGSDFAAKSKKDGYTLLYGNTSAVVYRPAFNPASVPYDPLRDLEPLGMHVAFPDTISVKTDAPWKNFQEVIEYAKKNPGKFRCGTLGVGSSNHFRLEMIKETTGVNITMVPFKGAMPAVTALLGGHIESAFVAVAISEPHFKSGKLKGILLDQKVPGLPDIPTLQDLGYKRVLPLTFLAFFAPAGIPEEAKNILVPAIKKAAMNPDLIAKLQKMWILTKYKSPEELRQIMSEDYGNARKMAKQMNISK
jgi:tripartite-type tricarboxylate transporter receptor subunit TctC